jgi:hypothetical protein
MKTVLFLLLKEDMLVEFPEPLAIRSFGVTSGAIGSVTDGAFDESTVSVSTIIDFVATLLVGLSEVFVLENKGLINSFFFRVTGPLIAAAGVILDTGDESSAVDPIFEETIEGGAVIVGVPEGPSSSQSPSSSLSVSQFWLALLASIAS